MKIILISNSTVVHQYMCSLSRLAIALWTFLEAWDECHVEVCCA